MPSKTNSATRYAAVYYEISFRSSFSVLLSNNRTQHHHCIRQVGLLSSPAFSATHCITTKQKAPICHGPCHLSRNSNSTDAVEMAPTDLETEVTEGTVTPMN